MLAVLPNIYFRAMGCLLVMVLIENLWPAPEKTASTTATAAVVEEDAFDHVESDHHVHCVERVFFLDEEPRLYLVAGVAR